MKLQQKSVALHLHYKSISRGRAINQKEFTTQMQPVDRFFASTTQIRPTHKSAAMTDGGCGCIHSPAASPFGVEWNWASRPAGMDHGNVEWHCELSS